MGVVRLLVLGAGPPQLGVLAAARRRGLTVVAADRDPSAPGFRHADRRAIVSIEDEPAIDRLARAEEVDGLIAAGTDHAVAIAARVAQRLGLPHPVSPEAAALAASKLRQRERLGAAGFAQPRSLTCRTAGEAAAAAAELGFPLVVEAPNAFGERAIRLARTPDELAAATAGALADSGRDYCLVEEMPGLRPVTVNGFVIGGRFFTLMLTDPQPAPPPAFGVPLAHVWPAALSAEESDAVSDTAAAAAAALGIEHGPVTAQLLLGPTGPLVAKVSARVGGGHDAELCRAALGIDESALAVAAALGEEVHEHELEPTAVAGGACVRFLVAPRGVLDTVDGVERASAVAGVRGVRIYRAPGHVFGELLSASDRAGSVIATGSTRERAFAAAAEAADCIRFVTAPVEAVA
jgi:biotin carboxylase